MLNFPGCDLTEVMAKIPDNHSVLIRVVDNTNGADKRYPFQTIHSIPFSFVSQTSKQLVQMDATEGQVLAWQGTHWAPKTLDTSIPSGSVTEDMLQGNIPRSKLAVGAANEIVVNDSFGNLSSLSPTATRALIGAMATTDVPVCNLPHQKLQMNPGPMFWGCVDDLTEDDTKLPLAGGTLTGSLFLKGDPGDDLEAATKAYVDSQVESVNASQWTTISGSEISYTGTATTTSIKLKPNTYQVELKANSLTGGNLQLVLPPDKGAAGQALVTDGNGNLSWAAPAAADSSTVGGDLTGTVALAEIKSGVVTSDKIADGTITNADISALADIEQSKIKDFALTLSTKQDKIIGGSSGEYWDGSRKWVTLDTSKVLENGNLYFTETRVRDAISASAPLIFNNTTGDLSFLAPGASGNLLRSNGSVWESWSPNYLVSEEDDLQTVTDRGATTITFSKFNGGASFSKIGIGTDSPVGVLDIRSTTSGILIPRMTEAERDLIASPTGMQIYNTSTNKINFHDGTSWKALGVAGSGVQSIATGTGLISNTITDTGTIHVDVGIGAGQIPKLNTSGKLETSVESDPTVQAFAKAALPTCGVGQVLKSNGTSFSCVADVDTFLVADGTSLVTSGSTISVKAEGILDTNLKGISSSCNDGQILLTNGLGAFYCGNRYWGEFAGGIFFNSGSVAIGGVASDSKAILDLQSTTKGFLPPRMSTAQRDGILSPTPGLMIYNNSTHTLQYYNNTKWIDLYGGTVVLDSGTISGTVTLSKSITIDQPAVVIFTSTMKGENFPLVTLQLNGTTCGIDRSFNDLGNLYSSATCVKDLAVGTHTIKSSYSETTGSVNMNSHSMSWTVIAKNAGGSGAPVAGGGGESLWDENGQDLYYTEGNVGIGTSLPDSRLSVNGDISLAGSLKVKSGSFLSELKGNPSASENLLFVLPSDKGASGQSLVTDGDGNLSWVTTTPADSSIEYTKLNLNDGDIPQSKVSGLVTDLSNKEPKITTGTSLQYIRGDKTLATLNTTVVPEGTNKYFTEDKVLGSYLTGYLVGDAEPILFTDTLLSAFGKLQAQISSTWNKSSTNVYYNGGNVGIGTSSPGSKLTVTGPIESTSGGIKFPDGTTQTTAALSSNYGVQLKLGTFDSPGTTGNYSVTGLGFKPSHVRLWAQNNRTGSMNGVSTSFCTGAMTENFQMSYYSYANTPQVRNLTYTDRVLACSAADAILIQIQASYVSMDPDGFTLNFSPTLAGWKIYYEATGGSTVANAGSGSANSIPVWTSSTGLGNSPLTTASGNVGIGTSSPQTTLDIHSTQPSSSLHPFRAGLLVSGEGTDVGGRLGLRVASTIEAPWILAYRSRGTLDAPTPVQTGDILLGMIGAGYDGVGHTASGTSPEIVFKTTENWSSTAHGGEIHFKTIENGTSNAVARMTIASDGNVGIGNASPAALLDIGIQSSLNPETTSAIFTRASDPNFQMRAISGSSSNATGMLIGKFGMRYVGGLGVGDTAMMRFYRGSTNLDGRMAIATNDTDRLTVTALGDVGIGTTTPSQKLHVIGNILASGTVTPSDRRLKKNFQSVENALEKINTLSSVTYDWKEPEKHGEGRQLGVIAQEVKEVFPEAVTTTNDGFLAVSYSVLVSPVIAAVKELYQKITGVEREIAGIKEENQVLKLENQEIKEKNQKLESENAMIKAYLCEKDAEAPFCKAQ